MNHREAIDSLAEKVNSMFDADIDAELLVLFPLFKEIGISIRDDFDSVTEYDTKVMIETVDRHDDHRRYEISHEIIDAEDPVKAAKISTLNKEINKYRELHKAALENTAFYEKSFVKAKEKLKEFMGKDK